MSSGVWDRGMHSETCFTVSYFRISRESHTKLLSPITDDCTTMGSPAEVCRRCGEGNWCHLCVLFLAWREALLALAGTWRTEISGMDGQCEVSTVCRRFKSCLQKNPPQTARRNTPHLSTHTHKHTYAYAHHPKSLCHFIFKCSV